MCAIKSLSGSHDLFSQNEFGLLPTYSSIWPMSLNMIDKNGVNGSFGRPLRKGWLRVARTAKCLLQLVTPDSQGNSTPPDPTSLGTASRSPYKASGKNCAGFLATARSKSLSRRHVRTVDVSQRGVPARRAVLVWFPDRSFFSLSPVVPRIVSLFLSLSDTAAFCGIGEPNSNSEVF